MATGLQMMLNAMGIEIDAKDVERVFALIQEQAPMLFVDGREKLKSYDERLANIEISLRLISEKLDALLQIDSEPSIRRAGVGPAQRDFERFERGHGSGPIVVDLK